MQYLFIKILIASAIGIIFVRLLFVVNRDFKKTIKHKQTNNMNYYGKQFNIHDVTVKFHMRNCIGCIDGGFNASMLIQYPKELLLKKEGKLV